MRENINVRLADAHDSIYIQQILDAIEISSKQPGTGICKRSAELLQQKMNEGHAVIGFCNNEWAGFSYLESWDDKEFVSHCALVIAIKFRRTGIAKLIKHTLFNLSRQLYPQAKIFGLTTSFAVMKINYDLGYQPVIYSELTKDERFWNACSSCANHPILISKEKQQCICTALLFKPPAT